MSVKYYNSAMTGHPVLSGTAGSLIAVLDACLVDGFGLGTVDSVVVASDIATVTRSAGHAFQVGSVALIAGATPAGLNGEQRVLTTTTTTYTFATTGINDQTATGTITHKVAPAGWTNTSVSGGNATLKAYQPTDAEASGCVLRVDDTASYHARVRGYETMSDVNTGIAPFPTDVQFAGGPYWPRSDLTTSAERHWHLVADERAVYFLPLFYSGNLTHGPLLYFGDLAPEWAEDAFACVLKGYQSAGNSNYVSSASSGLAYCAMAAAYTWAARSYTNVGSSCLMHHAFERGPFDSSFSQYLYSGGQGASTPYPNGPDAALLLSPMRAYDDPTRSLRGQFPGLYGVPQVIADGQFSQGDAVGGVTGLPGRTLRAFLSLANSAPNAKTVIDCTGPWR